MPSIDFADALGSLNDNSEMIRGYWKDLRDSWQASESALRRTLFYILALAAAFMLLRAKDITGVSVLGLSVTNLRLVETLIPAVISYLTYAASTNAAIATRLSTIHDQMAEHYWPRLYAAKLELTVRPVGSFAETSLITSDIEESFLSNVSFVAGLGRFLISIFAPIAFEVFTLVILFTQPGGILWLNCAVAAFAFLAIFACVPNLYYIFTHANK